MISPLRKFSYKRHQHFPLRLMRRYAPLVVEGLIFCNYPDNKNLKNEQGVFSVHTKTWHAIPPAPAPEGNGSISAYGMIVDTSGRPYSF